jgi:hypothetical protein
MDSGLAAFLGLANPAARTGDGPQQTRLLLGDLQRFDVSWKHQNRLSCYFRSTYLTLDDSVQSQVDLVAVAGGEAVEKA